MADRGRDLKFAVLSDSDKFDLEEPARDLEDLAAAAEGAGRDLERLGDDAAAAGRRLEADLGRDAKAAKGDLEDLETQAKRTDLDDTLGDDARRAARKVDDAFDTIARASRQSSRKVDDSTDRMRDSMRDVGDEAGSTAREMAASFSSGGDLDDAFQELAANAPAALGPIGLAAGAAAAVGVGLIRAEAEKIKELANDFADDILEGAGKITAAAVDERIKAMASEDADALVKLRDAATEAGLSVRDVIRAKAGDADAAARVTKEIDALNQSYEGSSIAAGTLTNEQLQQQQAANKVSKAVGGTIKALELAEDATKAVSTATAGAADAAGGTGAAFDDLRANLGRPIRSKVTLDAPSPAELDALVRSMRQQMGTLVVPVKAGQTRYSNTADNDRYRY